MPAPTGVQPAYLRGLSCPTSSFCAMVGMSSRTTNEQAVVVTWNGSSWTGRSLPVAGALAPNKTVSMGGISCRSATACVAVGNTELSYGLKFGVDTVLPFASSFNGISWTAHQVPNELSPAQKDSYGVLEHHAQVVGISCWAAQSCVVSGQGFFGSSLLKYVSGTWKLTTRSSASTSSDYGLSCTDATHCVGVHGTDAGGNIDLWNGSVWHSVFVGAPGFADVSCVSSTACVAVGGNMAAAGRNTWQQQQVTLPQSPLVDSLREISCSSDNHCVAISGAGFSPNLVATWNGSTWSTTARPEGLRSLTCPDDNTCYAVGPGGIILRQSSGAWQIATTAVHAAVLSCSSATSCLALGPPTPNAQGTGMHESTYRLTGQTWSTVSTLGGGSGSAFSPNGLSCPTAAFCLAVGSTHEGADMHTSAFSWNGSTWTEQLIVGAGNSSAVLESVSCSSATNCMTATNYPVVIARWDGSTLTQMATPADTGWLFSVSCASATFCVAITGGNDSQTLNGGSWIWDGVSWTDSAIALLPSGKNTELFAVSCSANQCMAVGGNGAGIPEQPIAEQLN